MTYFNRFPAELDAEIAACGYFPNFVVAAIARALAGEECVSFLVHPEATFNSDAVGRHLSVLLLTSSRLIIGHTDSGALPGEPNFAITTCESVSLRKIDSVAVSELVADPEQYQLGTDPTEAWLNISWGVMRDIDLEPASCGDPSCDADHGYSGQSATDDLTIRMSTASEGAARVQQLLAFGTALQLATR